MDLIPLIDDKIIFIVPALWVIGYFLKEYSPAPDWIIVWVLLILAIIASVIILGFTIEAIVAGILASAVANHGHQLIKQTKEGTDGQFDNQDEKNI